MAAFNYTAVDQNGKRTKGIFEADSARQVRQKLRDQKLVPLDVVMVEGKQKANKNTQKIKKRFRSLRMKTADLMLVTRQLATLLGAGIPLDETLAGVAEQAEKNNVKSILLGVRAKVLEGQSLAASMDAFPQAFPTLYRTTVASGERSGQLDLVLEKLAVYTEKKQHIRNKVQQALIYPSMMTLVSISVVVFLLIYVVPKIVHVFAQTQQTLPLSTTILINASQFILHDGWYLLLSIIALAFGCYRLLKNQAIHARWDGFLMRMPILGRAIKTVNAARFGRTLGILNAASVPVLEALQVSASLIKPLPMKLAVEQAIAKVREGAHIHLALKETRFFAPMFIHLVASGEASGQLEAMLEKAADHLEGEVETLIQNTLTLFEPIMILLMGAIVLYIVLAIMLPIFAMDNLSAM